MQGTHLRAITITSAILAILNNDKVWAADEEFLAMSPGSCSTTCPKEHSKSGTSDFLFECSCSPSCALYKDCCYNSMFRPKNTLTKSPKPVCLFLAGKGRFEAIATCSRTWNKTSEFCIEGIGHLPPVTSMGSGVTYANIHCALCNLDGLNLIPWKVDLKCCPEHDTSEGDIQYHFSSNHLWSILINAETEKEPPKQKCLCQYVAKPGASKFSNGLELRRCGAKTEISTCSTWWSDKETADPCKDYIDPIYFGDKVYRNMHCAECNYENLANSRCRPVIVDEIFLAGAKYADARKYCEEHGLRACVHFLGSGRGRKYAFSKLFNTWEMQCVPPTGKRCCSGYRYDFRHKTCRKFGTGGQMID